MSKANLGQAFKSKITRRNLVATIAVGSVGALALKWTGALGSPPYERGYGDTILRYTDRSYEGASWQQLPESASIGEVLTVKDSADKSRPFAVAGWDDDSYWIAREAGQIVQLSNGHWKAIGRPTNATKPYIRAISKDSALVAGGHTPRHLYRVSAVGMTDFGDLDFSNIGVGTELCPIADDLFYCFSREWEHLNYVGVVKVAGDQRTDLPPDKYKEAFVHLRDNTPLKEYAVRRVQYTCSPKAGKAFGVALHTHWGPAKVVGFENGIWYVIGELADKDVFFRNGIHAAWFVFANDEPTTLILVGDEGYVQVHSFHGPQVQRNVTVAQEPTSLKLIRVWGVNAYKFWVMDENGTVWEQSAAGTRAIVRGLYRQDVAFRDAWVSPTGMVVAISDKHVYRLA